MGKIILGQDEWNQGSTCQNKGNNALYPLSGV